jgi:hypothetical protein
MQLGWSRCLRKEIPYQRLISQKLNEEKTELIRRKQSRLTIWKGNGKLRTEKFGSLDDNIQVTGIVFWVKIKVWSNSVRNNVALASDLVVIEYSACKLVAKVRASKNIRDCRRGSWFESAEIIALVAVDEIRIMKCRCGSTQGQGSDYGRVSFCCFHLSIYIICKVILCYLPGAVYTVFVQGANVVLELVTTVVVVIDVAGVVNCVKIDARVVRDTGCAVVDVVETEVTDVTVDVVVGDNVEVVLDAVTVDKLEEVISVVVGLVLVTLVNVVVEEGLVKVTGRVVSVVVTDVDELETVIVPDSVAFSITVVKLTSVKVVMLTEVAVISKESTCVLKAVDTDTVDESRTKVCDEVFFSVTVGLTVTEEVADYLGLVFQLISKLKSFSTNLGRHMGSRICKDGGQFNA